MQNMVLPGQNIENMVQPGQNMVQPGQNMVLPGRNIENMMQPGQNIERPVNVLSELDGSPRAFWLSAHSEAAADKIE